MYRTCQKPANMSPMDFHVCFDIAGMAINKLDHMWKCPSANAKAEVLFSIIFLVLTLTSISLTQIETNSDKIKIHQDFLQGQFDLEKHI